jgi:DNA ligase-1
LTRDKQDGIRAQLVRRGAQDYLWSRGEYLITERFPELAAVRLPEGAVVDGEVLVWGEGDAAAPFAELQRRIGRKTLSAKLLAELPAVLVAYDLLELDGVDTRALPQHERRALLETVVAAAAQPQLKLSPQVAAAGWPRCAPSRAEKFGPVRSVRPTMVFEIGFEGIAVRFPRILRRRDDKTVDDADSPDTFKGLLAAAAP